MPERIPAADPMTALALRIKSWGRELGFQQVGISDVDLGEHPRHLARWLAKGYHGDLEYMAAHGEKRGRPDLLQPGTRRVISVRMDYLAEKPEPRRIPYEPNTGVISRYARGRDYHKTMRKRLQQLAERISAEIGEHGYRAFVDSAPVLERAVAEQAGLGWIGKNTMLIHRDAGSFFFLGELFTDLPLPVDAPVSAHCGSCSACLDICPTRAIVAPYELDARRCISYLTIENRGPIPEEFRPLIGNRVFGCDDCQLICPWNRYARLSGEKDFQPRHGLERLTLAELFAWTEAEFLHKTEGSPIRRTGYAGFLRNVAVGLGNAPGSPEVLAALRSRRDDLSDLVREHVNWALDQHQKRRASN